MELCLKKRKTFRPGVVAHSYNPSYSGGKDLEDNDLRAAQIKS
jgi:hypothetical protein